MSDASSELIGGSATEPGTGLDEPSDEATPIDDLGRPAELMEFWYGRSTTAEQGRPVQPHGPNHRGSPPSIQAKPDVLERCERVIGVNARRTTRSRSCTPTAATTIPLS